MRSLYAENTSVRKVGLDSGGIIYMVIFTNFFVTEKFLEVFYL